jgi:nitric oxide reductase subunit C
MSEKALRSVFIFGNLFFFVILAVMTADSLRQVKEIRTPPLTDQVVEGKRIWQSKNCNDCHTILGIGGYYAPELTQAIDRRGAAWLQNWLVDPLSMDPAASMPNQQLDASQAEALTAFLEWVSQIDTNDWPPEPLGVMAGDAIRDMPAGQRLFERKGCSGCHQINGRGTAGPGPDLSQIGAEPYADLPNTAEFLALWLADPAAQKPDTLMPRIQLTDAEIQILVEYLTSLK